MEQLKHECGIAMIRLLKPLEYYAEKYGTWMFGLNKLYLLMEKQHNRGQEGAGLACVKLDVPAGEEYMFRERALGTGAITEIFSIVQQKLKNAGGDRLTDAAFARRELPFAGEVYMGHLRYSTTGKKGLSFVHPFLRRDNWRATNLALCGNFNLTNVDEVFAEITAKGQHPRIYSDTYIMLEQVGHRLDRESERLYAEAVARGLQGADITRHIEEHIDVDNVLRTTSPSWDGGYVVCELRRVGDFFVDCGGFGELAHLRSVLTMGSAIPALLVGTFITERERIGVSPGIMASARSPRWAVKSASLRFGDSFLARGIVISPIL